MFSSTTKLSASLATFFVFVKGPRATPRQHRQTGASKDDNGGAVEGSRKGHLNSLYTPCSLKVPRARRACAIKPYAQDDHDKTVLDARLKNVDEGTILIDKRDTAADDQSRTRRTWSATGRMHCSLD